MIAANVALIAILQATWQPSHRLNSGSASFALICLKICTYVLLFIFQSLYVAQLEPELLLQPDRRHLPGKVEASNPSDVWEYLRVA